MSEYSKVVEHEQIPGSCWYKIKTSDNNVYYFNRETKETSWSEPVIPKKTVDELDQTIVAEYKELIKKLNLPRGTNYSKALPKLLYEEAHSNVPQHHRQRLYDIISRELLKASAKKTSEVYKEMVDSTDSHCDPATEESQYSKIRKVNSNLQFAKDYKKHFVDEKESAAVEIAINAFKTCLHERIKMPFLDGKQIEYPSDIIDTDKRACSEHLHNRSALYKEFVAEYLKEKLELFRQQLQTLDSSCVSSSLSEIIDLIGNRLFKHLPEDRLARVLANWQSDKKLELFDVFNRLLQLKVRYRHSASMQDNIQYTMDALSHCIEFKQLEFDPEKRMEMIKQRLEQLKEAHANLKPILLMKG